MAQRSEICFEKCAEAPLQRTGRQKGYPGTWKGRTFHRQDAPFVVPWSSRSKAAPLKPLLLARCSVCWGWPVFYPRTHFSEKPVPPPKHGAIFSRTWLQKAEPRAPKSFSDLKPKKRRPAVFPFEEASRMHFAAAFWPTTFSPGPDSTAQLPPPVVWVKAAGLLKMAMVRS